jgi:aryl-alcohol dehydrogenase-like predicted oxidoreductase
VNRRTIGSLEVSIVGLGTNSLGFSLEASEVPAVVDAALECGINFFDTADVYRDSEARLAAALGNRRKDVVIATKFGNVRKPDGTWGVSGRPDYVLERIDAARRRMDLETIDLLQLHGYDPTTPLAETLGALGEAVAAGKVREIGCSNFTAAQLREADEAAGNGPRFVSVQNMMNMLQRRDLADVLPTCENLGLAYVPYWPLANGLLSGKYERGRLPAAGTRLHRMGRKGEALLNDATFDLLDRLSAWSQERGHALLDLAIAWIAARPAVASVIAGATRSDQVRANATAGTWALTADEVCEVDRLLCTAEPVNRGDAQRGEPRSAG